MKKEKYLEKFGNDYVPEEESFKSTDSIFFTHSICNKKFKARADLIANHKSTCKYCYSNWKDLDDIKKILDNSNMELISYNDLDESHVLSTDHLIIKCKECSSEYDIKASYLKDDKYTCITCHNLKQRKDISEVEKEIKDILGDEYQIIGKYEKSDVPIKLLHTKCGKELNMLTGDIRAGKKCKYCNGNNVLLTRDQVAENIKNESPEYELIGDYVNNKVRVRIKHLLCNKVFYTKTTNFISLHTRCPYCNKSKSENELFEFIHSLDKSFIQSAHPFKDNKLEIDIYSPDKKIGIEFDGLYWHSENIVGRKYQLEKTKLAEGNGIRLIHVFEDEWIEKQKLVKDKIKHIIKCDDDKEKIYARKCTIKEISGKEKNEFLNKNHIQGTDNSTKSIGLYYNDILMSIMTFSKPRLGIGKNTKDEIELVRFASNINYNVLGGFGKLLKYATTILGYDTIYSYGDYRWVDKNNNVYVKNNFEIECINKPNYWYFLNKTRTHRFNFRKDKIKTMFPDIYNKDLTEFEMMDKTNYKRIWDCGTIRFILKNSKLS